MARSLTANQIATIHANKGLPIRDIARRANCSAGIVHKILSGPAIARGKGRKVAAPPAPRERATVDDSAPPAPSGPREVEGESGSPLDRLGRSLVSLESAARLAARDGDVARMVQVERAVGDITSLIARLTPAPPPDPNEDPDYIAFADAGERRLLKMLDGVFEGAENWPQCPACGRRDGR